MRQTLKHLSFPCSQGLASLQAAVDGDAVSLQYLVCDTPPPSHFPLLWCGTLSQCCRGILCLQPRSSLRFPPARYFSPFSKAVSLRSSRLAAGLSCALQRMGWRQLQPSVSCTGQPPTASTSPQTPSTAMKVDVP